MYGLKITPFSLSLTFVHVYLPLPLHGSFCLLSHSILSFSANWQRNCFCSSVFAAVQDVPSSAAHGRMQVTSVFCFTNTVRVLLSLNGTFGCGSLSWRGLYSSKVPLWDFLLTIWADITHLNSRGRHKNMIRGFQGIIKDGIRNHFILSHDIYFSLSLSRCQTQLIKSQYKSQNILKWIEFSLESDETTCEPINICHRATQNMTSEVKNDLFCLLLSCFWFVRWFSHLFLIICWKRCDILSNGAVWEKIEQWL